MADVRLWLRRVWPWLFEEPPEPTIDPATLSPAARAILDEYRDSIDYMVKQSTPRIRQPDTGTVFFDSTIQDEEWPDE